MESGGSFSWDIRAKAPIPRQQSESTGTRIVMSDLTLVIGNKNYSSWSLRPWLALRNAGIPFDERLLLLFDENWREAHRRRLAVRARTRPPTWRAHDLGDLAIIEYANELFGGRALARGPRRACHSPGGRQRDARGLQHRSHAYAHEPASPRPQGEGPRAGRRRTTSPASARSGRDCRGRYGAAGDFLFGAFGAANAMFAPVVTRMDTYGVDLDETCAAYRRAVLTLPAFVEWRDAALQEPWIVPEDEID